MSEWMDDLLKLNDLREKGLLTEEEFEAQKKLIIPAAESSIASTKPEMKEELEQQATTAPDSPVKARQLTGREIKASKKRYKREQKKAEAEAKRQKALVKAETKRQKQERKGAKAEAKELKAEAKRRKRERKKAKAEAKHQKALAEGKAKYQKTLAAAEAKR